MSFTNFSGEMWCFEKTYSYSYLGRYVLGSTTSQKYILKTVTKIIVPSLKPSLGGGDGYMEEQKVACPAELKI